MELFNRIESASFSAIAVGIGIEVRLKGRLKNQHDSGLHRPVRYSWDTQRSLTVAPELWVQAALAAGGEASPVQSDGMLLARDVS